MRRPSEDDRKSCTAHTHTQTSIAYSLPLRGENRDESIVNTFLTSAWLYRCLLHVYFRFGEHANMRSKDLLTREITDNCIDCEIFFLSPSLVVYLIHSERCLDITWSWNYEWASSLSGWIIFLCRLQSLALEFFNGGKNCRPWTFVPIRYHGFCIRFTQLFSWFNYIPIHSCEKIWKLKSLGRACRTTRTRHTYTHWIQKAFESIFIISNSLTLRRMSAAQSDLTRNIVSILSDSLIRDRARGRAANIKRK